jgi:DNA-binding transcriptional regulator YdaS (Cro superfamily)
MTIKELVAKLGGPTKVSQRIRIRPQAVSLWVTKGRVPANRVPTVVRLAREAGLTVRPEEIRSDIDWNALV